LLFDDFMKCLLLAPLVFLGCREASSAERTSHATVTGTASFRDVDLDRDGAHRQVNLPAGQAGTLRVIVHGMGNLTAASCSDAGAGQFIAYYDAQLQIAGDGTFSAPLYANNPPVFTASGCPVQSLDVSQITNVEMAAELPMSTDACRDLCDGRGRQVANERCQQTSDRAGCIAPIQEDVAAQCGQACMTSGASVSGRGGLDGSVLAGSSTGSDLMDGNLGDLRAHLEFDQMLDANRAAL
jgi:hypothetical protein